MTPAEATDRPPLIAVLAAGRGMRFGGGKLDADCAGRPLGRWILDMVVAAGAAPGIVVTGQHPPRFAQDATAAGWSIVVNEDAEMGLGTSVATASRHATAAGAAAVIILLGDMPLITPAIVATLLKADDGAILATRHDDGRAGAPARFPRR
ncbi:MAG: NTP transferase domain-containing protein, partial [Sphingobium sp.]